MRRIIFLSAALAFSACGGEARQDSDKSNQTIDKSSAVVIAYPDGFRNVAHKCDGHGHRVYSSSSGNSGTYPNLYVINDSSCDNVR